MSVIINAASPGISNKIKSYLIIKWDVDVAPAILQMNLISILIKIHLG